MKADSHWLPGLTQTHTHRLTLPSLCVFFVLESSCFYFEIWPHPCVPVRNCLSQTVPELHQLGSSWTRFQFVARLTPGSLNYSCTSATVPRFLF